MSKKEVFKLFDEILAQLLDAKKGIISEYGYGSAKDEANQAAAEEIEEYRVRLLELMK